MGLPVTSVDIGDVADVLARITPSAVVPFPEPWGTAAARAELVSTPAASLTGVLSGGGRGDGREHTAWLDTMRVAAVYRQAQASSLLVRV
jgi:teichuronic acid biosynthesis glycosyltransferase TuaC